jgi:hypothetical protein
MRSSLRTAPGEPLDQAVRTKQPGRRGTTQPGESVGPFEDIFNRGNEALSRIFPVSHLGRLRYAMILAQTGPKQDRRGVGCARGSEPS